MLNKPSPNAMIGKLARLNRRKMVFVVFMYMNLAGGNVCGVNITLDKRNIVFPKKM